MQLKPRDIPAFLKNPSAYRAIFIYGPDEGLVRSRKLAVLKALGVNRDDPFAYNEYEQSSITDEPNILHEGLSAMSLTGDAPCITITQASDKLTSHIKASIGETHNHNMLVVTGGDLPKRSTLRSFFENAKAKDIAAIPCYRDEGRSLEQVVRSFLQAKQIRATPPTLDTLCALLGNDRAVTLGELEKLDIYLGESRELDEETVLLALADNQHRVTGDCVLAYLSGDMKRFFTLCDNAFLAGESAIALLRAFLRYARQLLDAKSMQEQGSSAQQAVDSIRPFVFFKDKPAYVKALNRMNTPKLLDFINQLHLLEIECKSGKAPAELLFPHGLLLSAHLPQHAL